jgi:hypothetical protein
VPHHTLHFLIINKNGAAHEYHGQFICMQTKDFYSKKERDPISVADIEGTAAGTPPRSKS